MKIGFMGLGKLGLPCALATEEAGHEVVGFDPSEAVQGYVRDKKIPYREEGAPERLVNSKIRCVDVAELVSFSDIIFVAVQTPHDPLYEGISRIPETRVDFDYSYLIQACRALDEEIEKQGQDKVVVVISTVLPGTMDTYVKPHLSSHFKLCYNPFFIAMGTTIHDFTHPEFVLFGVDDEKAAQKAEEFYKTIHSRPFYKTAIKNAELIKVSYNTFISMKIAFVNNLMEVCHHTGADVDAVTDALKLGTERLVSPKYLSGGMGDGGGCHPRDNIALSWLSRKLGVRYDWSEAVMMAREKQTDFLADLVEKYRVKGDFPLPVIILGKAFKEQTNLVVGSPSVLLKNILNERGIDVDMYDPWIDNALDKEMNPFFGMGMIACYFIGTHHKEFLKYKFPKGSVVIDPWRYMPDQEGVRVIRVGQGKR